MNWDGQDRMQQAIEPMMHRKILLRAAELVAMGWTTGAGARSAGDARVRGTNPTAVSWCLTGAVFRALFEIVGLDGYEGREASIVDSVNFWWVLMQPLCRALAQRGGHEQVLESNDVWCREPAKAEAVLRKAAPCVAARWPLKGQSRHGGRDAPGLPDQLTDKRPCDAQPGPRRRPIPRPRPSR